MLSLFLTQLTALSLVQQLLREAYVVWETSESDN